MSILALGLNEFTLRLPSVLSGAAYLVACVLITRTLFGPTLHSFLSLALLTLNPLILDFLSAARGYGMALALLAWAFLLLCRSLASPPVARTLIPPSLCVALAVAANVGVTFAATALALSATTLMLARAPVPQRCGAFFQIASLFVLPGLLVVWPFLRAPLSNLHSGIFYVGVHSLHWSVWDLIHHSLVHAPITPHRPIPTTPIEILVKLLAWALAPLVLIAAAAVLSKPRSPDTQPCTQMLCATFILTILFMVVARVALGALYPVDRVGLPLVFLFTLTACALLHRINQPRTQRVVIVGLALFCLQMVAQLTVTHYAIWRYDARTRELLLFVRDQVGDSPPDSIQIANSWELEPSLTFYRNLYQWEWLSPITRDQDFQSRRSDFHLMIERQHFLLPHFDLYVMYRDPLSGTLVARRRARVPWGQWI